MLRDVRLCAHPHPLSSHFKVFMAFQLKFGNLRAMFIRYVPYVHNIFSQQKYPIFTLGADVFNETYALAEKAVELDQWPYRNNKKRAVCHLLVSVYPQQESNSFLLLNDHLGYV